ncbi:MAG: serine/threonine protein kinase [Kofleriaceae bacterium]|nr:serine/threonine protein kinase [Kofleriaceae bacterium]
MTCPNNNRINEFVSGVLKGAPLVTIEEHIDQCMSCRELVSVLTKLRQEMLESQEFRVDEVAWPVPERYEISHLLGRGGMGSVFLAKDRKLRRNIALKMMRPQRYGDSDTTKMQERFVQEAQNMAQISHPNVVTIHDYGHHEGYAYIAMEYVDCQSLSEWLREGTPSLEKITSVLLQAGEGLVAAHEAGLIHRDFKPDNVLVAKDGRVLITDFGLSSGAAIPLGRETGVSDNLIGLTQTGMMLGTPIYMAPEQHRGEVADERSDQYSFCASFYEALAGSNAFAGDSSKGLAANKQANKMRPLPARLPKYLRGLIEKGLRADPVERHASVRVLLSSISTKPQRRYLPYLGVAAVAAAAIAFLTYKMWPTESSLASQPVVANQTIPVDAAQHPVNASESSDASTLADTETIGKPANAEEQVSAPSPTPVVIGPKRRPPRGAKKVDGAPSNNTSALAVKPRAARPGVTTQKTTTPGSTTQKTKAPGAARPKPVVASISARTTIDIEGENISHTERYTNCLYCDVSDSGSRMLLRFQQGKGYLVWSLYLRDDSKPGTQPLQGSGVIGASSVFVAFSSPDAAFKARGGYNKIIASKKSTVTLSKVDMVPGGLIVGRVDAYLQNSESKVQLHIVSTFRAQVPR